MVVESETSGEICAASASLNSQPEEALLEFMRTFVKMLFTGSSTITLQMKSEFAIHARVSVFNEYIYILNARFKHI